jgi:hypothetical protein
MTMNKLVAALASLFLFGASGASMAQYVPPPTLPTQPPTLPVPPNGTREVCYASGCYIETCWQGHCTYTRVDYYTEEKSLKPGEDREHDVFAAFSAQIDQVTVKALGAVAAEHRSSITGELRSVYSDKGFEFYVPGGKARAGAGEFQIAGNTWIGNPGEKFHVEFEPLPGDGRVNAKYVLNGRDYTCGSGRLYDTSSTGQTFDRGPRSSSNPFWSLGNGGSVRMWCSGSSLVVNNHFVQEP